MLALPWDPALFSGLAATDLTLPEYDGPYAAVRAEAGAPLLDRLARDPLVRIPLPEGWRAEVPALCRARTSVTSPVHSQPPHVDHPHRVGDPRRYNMFWAERPRLGASTYFLPIALAPWVADWLTGALRGLDEAWLVAQPRVGRFREDPNLLSRYRVPVEAVDALEALLRVGEPGRWMAVSPVGQLLVLTRALGNTELVTALLERLFDALREVAPGALVMESWTTPAMVLADDTRLLHGRYGVGDSGEGFFRTWLCGPAGEVFEYGGG